MSPERTRPTVRRRLLWLGAELAVVFVGVFGAFLLDDYRAARRDAERERQALAALRQQYGVIRDEFNRERPFVVAAVDTFEARYRRGERPRPFPLSFIGSNSTGMWEALLASSGDVLDPDLVVDVEVFNIYVRSTWDGASRLRDLSDRYLLPRLSDDLSTFYLPDGRFRPEYRWYFDGLLDLRTRMTSLSARLDSTYHRLDAALHPTNPD
ncbi:MAG: hypothetical protein R3247_08450 [Rhodothermales bacterium]|nr:hypothetical protein [Rhodothermales bacterium]